MSDVDAQLKAEGVTAKSRYTALETERRPYLDRARECAALTIPSVMPPEGFGKSSKLATPYQSLGARGVRTLASKLLLSLFPGVPFFNYKIDDQSLQELGEKRGEIEKALASRERAVATELDTSVFRPEAFTALEHLIVTGNIMVYIPPKQEDRAQCYRLDQFVTRRDAAGNLLEFVIKEEMDLWSIPLTMRVQLRGLDKFKELKFGDPALVEVFTHGFIDPDNPKMWIVRQEAEEILVEGSEGKYPEGNMPYLALRLSKQPSESYGRAYVEELLGDLDSLEALSEALVEGSAAAAKIVFMVRPGGTTSLKVVAEAPNGKVISGDPDDVGAMRLEKANDLSVAKQQAEEIGTRLAYAFLLNSAVQRAGERVTAEEIRYMAVELDDALGGVYTLLAADFQRRAVPLFERRMEKRLKSTPLPDNMVQPVIVAGLEAIGRGHSQRNLKAFVSEIFATLTPEIAAQYINISELIARSAAAYGIDTEGLIASEEEIQAKQQQGMQQQLMQMFGPELLKQGGKLADTGLKGSMAAPSQGT